MINKLAIMRSTAVIMTIYTIIIARIMEIPSSSPWHTVIGTVIIITRHIFRSSKITIGRCGCGILRKMMNIIARIIHSWQIPNRSKYSKGVVTNEA
tara:strand:+ start:57 stop:344 length:288 start_codon:yes stop_codon:yes gene_type:complete